MFYATELALAIQAVHAMGFVHRCAHKRVAVISMLNSLQRESTVAFIRFPVVPLPASSLLL